MKLLTLSMCVVTFHIAPEYSRESWSSVKYTLGLDFPNVSK